MSRALAPKGGNDEVYTPRDLAFQIVEHFRPSGSAMEPCIGPAQYGRQFGEALRSIDNVYEIFDRDTLEEKDFFEFTDRVDWIVTNPPWSQFRPFLQHSMKLADNVVFLCLVNAWFMKARVEDMRAAGFGLVEILYVPTPPKPWPQTGFALGAGWVRRGWTGGCHHNYSLLDT